MHQSIDRFFAYLLENTKGALPAWLSKVQVNILPVNNKYHSDYANYVKKRLEENLLTNNKYNNINKILNDEVSKFLSLYFNATNYTSDIQKLKEDIKAYNDLNIKYDKYIKDSNENNDNEIYNYLINKTQK